MILTLKKISLAFVILNVFMIQNIKADMMFYYSAAILPSIVSSSSITHVSNTSELRTALINAGKNGKNDKIILADGIYKTTDDGQGTFTYQSTEDKKLFIIGSSRENVILSGDNQDRVLLLESSEFDAYFTLKNLSVIYGNATDEGGGVASQNTLEVDDCNISHNEVHYGSSSHDGIGGGISMMHYGGFNYSTHLYINDSIFTYNSAYSRGGGYYAYKSEVKNSIFKHNSADEGGGAFAYYYQMDNTIFTNNNATSQGGALYSVYGDATYHSKAHSANNLFMNNSSGIYFAYNGYAFVTNSIFRDNNNVDIEGTSRSTVDIKNCYIDKNNITISVVSSGLIFTGINLGFADEANGDYHLTSSSGLIDKGLTTDSKVVIPTTDFDGVSRPQGASTDIGPYEYQP